MDLLTLELLRAQHPRAAVMCTVVDEVDCADCAMKWTRAHTYYVEDLELAPDFCDGIECGTCGQKMEHITWTC